MSPSWILLELRMVEEVVVTTGVQSSSQIVTTNTNQHPAPGQTKTTMFFVILVTHPKSYTETMDRRDFGGKPSQWK